MGKQLIAGIGASALPLQTDFSEPPGGFMSAPPQQGKGMVGPSLMSFEAPGAKFSAAKVEALKKEYSASVNSMCQSLLSKGFKPPKTKEELEKLCKATVSLIWTKFKYDETVSNSLLDSFANKKFDCDTSSFLVADILGKFGVESRLVSLPHHALLHVTMPGASLYLETTKEKIITQVYGSHAEFKKAYPNDYGECAYTDKNFISYKNRGYSLAELGKYNGAIADYDMSIQLNPLCADAFLNRGDCKLAYRDYSSAIRDYNEAIRLNPKLENAFVNRGVLKAALGDLQGAMADYNEAIKLVPIHGPAYYNRGNLKVKMGDLNGALSDYCKSIQLTPKDVQSHYNIGTIKAMLSDFKGAAEEFTKTIQLSPMHAGAYYSRGIARQRLGDVQGAEADIRKAQELGFTP